MSEKMNAYRMINWGEKPQQVEVEKPVAGPGEVVLKVAGNGLCGSDPKMCKLTEEIGTMIQWQMPFTLGHEAGGWVEEIGEGVVGFEKGDPVVLMSSSSCGKCSYCLEGNDNNCDYGHFGRGYGRNGSLAPYVLVNNPREIIKLNTLDPVTAGPLTDAAATSYHGVKKALPKLKPGTTALVIGAGGLGSFAVQLVKVLSPARVVAVDTNPARLDYVKGLGADEVVDGTAENSAELIQQALQGGAAAVFDFVGTDQTIESGISNLRKGGMFVLVGSNGGKLDNQWYGTLPTDAEITTYQGQTISDTKAVIALAEAGLIRNDVDIYPFSFIEEAFEKLETGQLQGRAVIKMED